METTKITSTSWIQHVENDLMPFWMIPEALGKPLGNFPTFRLNNGQTGIMQNMPQWINDQSNEGQRDYLRMKSRQIFAYCTAFHMTGKEEYLLNAKKGIDYLLKQGGYETGCPVTFWENGVKDPDPLQRTSQDLAYSLNCLAMYYYITRDEKILDRILPVKEYIFREYFINSITFDNGTKIFQWVKKNFDSQNTTNNKELVGILDQLNSYLVLITHIIPDKQRTTLVAEMVELCNIMIERFYIKELNIFWGKLHKKQLGLGEHTDFGHSIKTLWMCYLVGKLAENVTLLLFGEHNAEQLLEKAFIPSTASWGSCYDDAFGKMSEDKVWWIYAELDQMAATLSFKKSAFYSDYLKNTYAYWFDYFVDKEAKEVWHALDKDGKPDKSIPKIHLWKNGYHSLEHALIGYLSTCKYNKEQIKLYYAFTNKSIENGIIPKPYYYSAKVTNQTESAFTHSDFASHKKVIVEYKDIQ